MTEPDTTPESGWPVVGDDGLARPPWAAHDPLLREYYDTEWGMPIRDERGLFERIALEGFQAGLSWATVLRKRPAFRAGFADFDPDAVAAFDEGDVERLMADAGIIRPDRSLEEWVRRDLGAPVKDTPPPEGWQTPQEVDDGG